MRLGQSLWGKGSRQYVGISCCSWLECIFRALTRSKEQGNPCLEAPAEDTVQVAPLLWCLERPIFSMTNPILRKHRLWDAAVAAFCGQIGRLEDMLLIVVAHLEAGKWQNSWSTTARKSLSAQRKHQKGQDKQLPVPQAPPQHRKVKNNIFQAIKCNEVKKLWPLCVKLLVTTLYNMQLHLGLHWAYRTGTITGYKCVHTPVLGFSKGSCEQLFGFTHLTHTFQIAAHRFKKSGLLTAKSFFVSKYIRSPMCANVHVSMCV